MATKTIHFQSPRLLNQLYCGKNKNLDLVEQTFKVVLTARDDWLQIEGKSAAVATVEELFLLLQEARLQGLNISDTDFLHMVSEVQAGRMDLLHETYDDAFVIKIKSKSIVPKTINQKRYLQYIQTRDIVFGIGPAGTGKTYLAVASALHAFFNNEVNRIILTRPAVEAGEALGFLPGDLREKILPYLRPLYDAMNEMIGPEETQRLIEKDIIEIAPLAYMRGRTLSNAYIILDEAQNTTPEQMMMCITRLGNGSRMVVTGDITQVDLPKHKTSGLKQAIHALEDIDGIQMFYFESKDAIRHPLVQRIIDAYQHFFGES